MKWVCYVLLWLLCVLECIAMSPSEIEDFSNYLKESSSLDQQVKSHREKGYEAEKSNNDNTWERSGKFEGDLILNDRQRRTILSNVAEGLARNGLADTTKRWPNNELIYFINTEHFHPDQIYYIQDGINGLASASCVTLRPFQQGDSDAVVIQLYRHSTINDQSRIIEALNNDLIRIHNWAEEYDLLVNPLKSQALIIGQKCGAQVKCDHYCTAHKLLQHPKTHESVAGLGGRSTRLFYDTHVVLIWKLIGPPENVQGNDEGCFSQVGYQGGYQVLNLDFRHFPGTGCFRQAVVMHELLHSLGFLHMQSSPDRDEYVDILWNNIIYDQRHNFRKYNFFEVTDFGVGYDYMSVMHYGRKAFSWNDQDTIVPKNGAEIGQTRGLSEKDVLKLNIMYCSGSPSYPNIGYGHGF